MHTKNKNIIINIYLSQFIKNSLTANAFDSHCNRICVSILSWEHAMGTCLTNFVSAYPHRKLITPPRSVCVTNIVLS